MLRLLPCLTFALLTATTAAYAAKAPDPSGLWLTENKRAAIRVEKCGASICGKIAWIIPGGMTRDTKNPDASMRNRSLCNLEILSGFTQNTGNAKVWEGGKIYKADEGGIYRATVSAISDNELYVRGYIGLPLLGKSQTWSRVSEKDYPACTP